MVTAYGYALGIHAPGTALMLDALPTAHHQLLGHGLATAALRAAGAGQVAITNNYAPAWPASGSAADGRRRDAYDILHNRLFTDPVLLGRYPDLSAFGLAPRPGLRPGRRPGGDRRPDGRAGGELLQPTRLSALPDSTLPFQMEPDPRVPGDRLRLAGGPGRADANC